MNILITVIAKISPIVPLFILCNQTLLFSFFSVAPIISSIYDRKKTFAEGLLDVAILIANATQLKAVVSNGPSNKYYIPLLVLISLSIVIQLIVAAMLLIIGATEKKENNKVWLHKMNNGTIGLILAAADFIFF
jgi:hypothetical protein